ncbi:TPK5 [Symbiodinium sp. CCMP2592]|nr:TPK5 [Symbiodinium sp. CCMP2592]
MAVEGQPGRVGGRGGGIWWDGMRVGRICDVHVPADLACRVSAHPNLFEEFRRKIVEYFGAPPASQPGKSMAVLDLDALDILSCHSRSLGLQLGLLGPDGCELEDEIKLERCLQNGDLIVFVRGELASVHLVDVVDAH